MLAAWLSMVSDFATAAHARALNEPDILAAMSSLAFCSASASLVWMAELAYRSGSIPRALFSSSRSSTASRK